VPKRPILAIRPRSGARARYGAAREHNVRLQHLGVRGSTAAPGAEFARYGGHTSCVALTAEGGDRPSLVLDAGTGLRMLTKILAGAAYDGSIVLSHLHWDHMQGLPFFAAGDRNESRVDLYMPAQEGRSGRDLLAQTLSPPAFPITPEGLRGTWGFHAIEAGGHAIEGFTVRTVDIEHKGGRTFGLRVDDELGSVAYLPDHAPAAGMSDELLEMLAGVDVLLHDAQFLEGERPVAVDYGHATVQDAVSLGLESGVDTLVLFHHSPARTDDALDEIGEWAPSLAGSMQVVVAREGDVMQVARQSPAEPASSSV
jgi:phosphoribosyl 1,2-cyclic phosphodiesterase